jgi:hypothetical protein
LFGNNDRKRVLKVTKCEVLERCIFFNDKIKNYPETADYLKSKYCLGDNQDCARYMVLKALGKEKVPVDLYPNDTRRAKIILSGD